MEPISLDAHDTFRNELASVAPDGRRRWVYARQPSGRFYRARTAVGAVLLAFLFAAPFVRVHGVPLMLLDVINRRFVLLGVPFWPQDFSLLVLVALAILVTLALVTAAVGRVWCGWACPQTIFMEMLFRRIEYLIDGSAEQQLRRDRAPWTRNTAVRRTVKHIVFLMLSFVIANVFLAYVIGSDALLAIVTAPPREHLPGLIAISLFSLVFYAVFARFREQVCTIACPYGRMMSSLIDPQTVTVTYDARRGEPRARLTAATASGSAPHGGCIDCHLCVTVCPMGIDIRNGIQLECIDCAACIDACDTVMTRVGRPRGLIRLTSDLAMRSGRSGWPTPRVIAYGLVWLLVVAATATLIARRRDLDVMVLRQPGSLFAEVQGGDIANFYTLQAFNRTVGARHFDIFVVEPAGASLVPLGPIGEVAPLSLGESRFVVQVPRAAVTATTIPLRFAVRTSDGDTRQISSSFVGPDPSAPRGADAAGRQGREH